MKDKGLLCGRCGADMYHVYYKNYINYTVYGLKCPKCFALYGIEWEGNRHLDSIAMGAKVMCKVKNGDFMDILSGHTCPMCGHNY